MSNTSNLLQALWLAMRLTVIATAYAAMGVLFWLTTLAGSDADVGAKQAQGWLVLMFLPIWLVLSLGAITSGLFWGTVSRCISCIPLALPIVVFIYDGFRRIDWNQVF